MNDAACGCGCCDGVTASTPRPLDQRHGLPSLAYRVGTHADFLASLVAALSDEDLPALAGLRSRDYRDFTMALVDGAATVCDVLTFYTERLAQESYLSTAVDRTSMQELGRLVAYRLRPGVASTTHLAFFIQPPAPNPAADEFAPGSYLRDGVELPAGLPVRSIPGPGEQPQTFETTETIFAIPQLNALRLWTTTPTIFGSGAGKQRVYLTGTGHRLKAGDWLLFRDGTTWDIRPVWEAIEQPEDNRTLLRWVGDVPNYYSSGAKLYVFRKTVSIFGHSAPYRKLVEPTATGDWSFDVGPGTMTVDLDGSHPDVLSGTFLVLERGGANSLMVVQSAREMSKSAYAISGKITRVGVNVNVNDYDAHLRDTVVYAVSQELPVAQEPDTSPLTGQWLIVHGDVDVPTGHKMLVAGTSTAGEPVTEPVTVQFAWRSSIATLLYFTGALTNTYRREGVVLYGNVAAATHGETVHQILGSGNGSAPHQRYTLKHGPLTYVPSADPAGATSTLEVRVNDVAWHEVPTLYEAKPGDRSYVTRVTDKGEVVAVFGDGERGARLPTGLNNVQATYRKGIGATGNLPSGAISQVMDPPLGLTKATNPVPATGGADPEPASAARRAIPLPVRTLGRAVSLVDYEDYSRAFAGIAKAHATVLNLVGGRTIVVTVAAADGTTVPVDTRERLVTSLRTYGDPMVSVLVLPYRPASFRLALRFKRDPAYLPALVAQAIRVELAATFAFAAREFGQPVHRSEVVAAVHRVPGVLAVDLDKLYRTANPVPPEPGWPAPTPNQLNGRLLAALPRATSAGTPLAAELLSIVAGDPFDSLLEIP